MSNSTGSDSTAKQCPYCGEYFDPRGLFTHIRQSSDSKHGSFNEVPDDFETKTETLESKSVPTVTTKSSSRSSEKHIYLGNWCNEMTRGKRGYNIHIGHKKGDGVHPEGASIEDEEYTLVPCDEDWNPLMDIDDIYDIQKRRRSGGKIGNF